MFDVFSGFNRLESILVLKKGRGFSFRNYEYFYKVRRRR